MRCSDAAALLPRYVGEDLAGSDRRRLADHLEQCARCRMELAQFARSQRALNNAAPGAAPDLWSSFQARLPGPSGTAAPGRADCARVSPLLPALADGAASAAERAAALHVEACPGCARELERLRRSLRALEAARSSPAREDLWPALVARMGAGIACSEVGRYLPAYEAGELREARALTIRAHLESCERCAAEAVTLRGPLAALQRAAGASAAPDLWPAFSARLAAERRAARRPLLARLAGAVPGPARRPALAFAAAAAALVLLRPALVAPPPVERQEWTARAPARAPRLEPVPSPERMARNSGPVGNAPVEPGPIAAAPRDREEGPAARGPVSGRPSAPRAVRSAAARISRRPAPAPAPPSAASQLQLALNPSLTADPLPEIAGTLESTISSRETQLGLMQDLTVLAASFDGVSDAVNSPLGTPDAH